LFAFDFTLQYCQNIVFVKKSMYIDTKKMLNFRLIFKAVLKVKLVFVILRKLLATRKYANIDFCQQSENGNSKRDFNFASRPLFGGFAS
jgi:hypothetical protein